MRRLERRLGTTLVVRDARRFELTADGALVGPAAGVVSAAARFTASTRAAEGVLRVAHASSVDTLSVVLDRYSGLHLQVRGGETDGEWPARDDLIASFDERRALPCTVSES